nr:sialidase family protein [Chitinophaga sp. GbtcB8]
MCCTQTHAQKLRVTLVKNELIMQNPPFAACHASTITALSNNRLMAAWFGGSRESAPDVCIYTSTYEDGQWSAPRRVADGVINDTLRYPCWNPVLFRTRAGRLLLFYKIGKSPREWWGVMRTSSDDGKHWSAAQKLRDSLLGPIKNKPVQLANGDILYPSSTESKDEKQWHIHLEKSDAEAQHWQYLPVNNDTFGVIQPSILFHKGDSLQLLCRSRQNYVVQCWSGDQGVTWGPLSKTDLPNPNSGTDAVTLRNGLQVLVYNPLSAGKEWFEGRSKLNVALSSDGRHWKDIYALEDQQKGEFSYPAIIQTPDGLLHITYTADRKNIRHVVLRVK